MNSGHDNEIKLGQNYKMILNKKLGSGAFGEIFSGVNLKTNEEVAIKMESVKSRYPQLAYETKILKYLQGGVGIPNVHYYYVSNDYNLMVIDLLGMSIEDLFVKCNRKFSLKTVLMLGDQMISRIEFIHSRHIIHRDIKPDNFIMGRGRKKNQAYIIDFGLAKRFRDSKTGEHIPYKDGKSLTGTARYASIYTHLGIEQSRRDDLEALGYLLMYLNKGSLPWQGTRAKNKKEKYQKIMEKKINTSLEDLCVDFPEEFINFFQYTRSLQFDEKPDYSFLKSLLQNMFDQYKYEFDHIYEWNLLDNSNNNPNSRVNSIENEKELKINKEGESTKTNNNVTETSNFRKI